MTDKPQAARVRYGETEINSFFDAFAESINPAAAHASARAEAASASARPQPPEPEGRGSAAQAFTEETATAEAVAADVKDLAPFRALFDLLAVTCREHSKGMRTNGAHVALDAASRLARQGAQILEAAERTLSEGAPHPEPARPALTDPERAAPAREGKADWPPEGARAESAKRAGGLDRS